MKRLSAKKYWDSVYEPQVLQLNRRSFKERLKTLLTKLLGENCLRVYADYLLWDVIYKKYLPKTKGLKMLEIGSAPGNNLVRFSRTFGFVPYGVEYSDDGIELNREIFRLHNINPDNLIHADFFSDEFVKQYKGSFDIVYSRGFIEHFTDVEGTVQRHIDLLTKGGYLVVIIPNFRGINYILPWILHKESLLIHNIDIMDKKKFSELFDRRQLSSLFCDYYGVFTFDLFTTKRGSPLRLVRTFCNILQLILNPIFHILFRNKRAENRLISPYLIYIGVKK